LGGGLMVVPNACVTLGVPVDIFDFDILPGAGGLKKLENPGSCPISDYK
jgi:formamidase